MMIMDLKVTMNVKAMNRPYNFGAGPAMLPESILLEAQQELLDWQGSGMSILEVGHRTPEFIQLAQDLVVKFRSLLNIPNNYEVLFMGGSARQHFSMIPLNLIQKNQQAAYLISGLWSTMAFNEACKIKKAYCLASNEASQFTDIPPLSHWNIEKNTAYCYYTPNETVNGVCIAQPPHLPDNLPLVADMTSCLLSEPININDYGLILAGAQKNIANAGLTFVIIRHDLLTTIDDDKLPTTLDYRTYSEHQSLYATPPTFNCYLALKMMDWIEAQGGVEKLYQLNCQKAALLYDYIDASPHYSCKIKPRARSILNVCFTMQNEDLENLFIEKSKIAGLLALKGHRMAGGLRASLYNAMPVAGVEKLLQFMDDFAKGQCL